LEICRQKCTDGHYDASRVFLKFLKEKSGVRSNNSWRYSMTGWTAVKTDRLVIWINLEHLSIAVAAVIASTTTAVKLNLPQCNVTVGKPKG
jgi:hypothetical protein